jgi:hypothetical protein
LLSNMWGLAHPQSAAASVSAAHEAGYVGRSRTRPSLPLKMTLQASMKACAKCGVIMARRAA